MGSLGGKGEMGDSNRVRKKSQANVKQGKGMRGGGDEKRRQKSEINEMKWMLRH